MKLLNNYYQRSIVLIYLLVSPLAFVLESKLLVHSQESSTCTIGKDFWNRKDYKKSLEPLLDCREKHRNAHIDYMIGTSYCRISQKKKGLIYLDWILNFYSLTQEQQNVIKSEKKTCSVARETSTLPGGGVTGSGKSFKRRRPRPEKLPQNKPIPSQELISRLYPLSQQSKAIESAQARLGSPYKVTSTSSFVLASPDHSVARLKEIGTDLEQVLNFFATEYNLTKPQSLISVYLTPNNTSMSDLINKIYGISSPSNYIGYSVDDDISMVGIAPAPSSSATFFHELFHLIVHQNFGDIPPWLDEGIASLYEGVKITNKNIRGITNWRGAILKDNWDRRPSIETLVKMNWVDFRKAEDINYATARYFALYLQEKKLLAKTCTVFRNREPRKLISSETSDVIGLESVKLLETELGASIQNIDRNFKIWFDRLE
jgi:hypothetical protein